MGHFAKVCRSTKQKNTSKRRETVKYTTTTDSTSATNDSSDTDNDGHDYAFAILPHTESVTITIEDEPINIVIDSGATCNVINTDVERKLRTRGVEPYQCRRKIHPYNSPPIQVIRAITAEIAAGGCTPISREFLVVRGNPPPLLCKETAEALNILSIRIPPNPSVRHITTSTPDPTNDILKSFPGIHQGIGRLKNLEVKLHIDKTVPPIARKHSRVPFHNRDKVAKELQRLQEQDIEKVSGPTEWVSRIVTPPKPKSPDEIRLCVDIRDTNKAMLRIRHVTSTISDLRAELNGATIFSKIDLCSGYHQLVLHPDCRYITTFSTHMGLYQYKRLIFGVNSAAEVFQHTIQTVLEGIKGAKNISDDIIVYGRDEEEHDRAPVETLKKLHHSGLTINRNKCEFKVRKIKFYGHIFTKEGISPDPEKVQALHEAALPTNQSEVRSFLGLAQCCSDFIDNFATMTEPLRELIKKDSPWKWGEHQESAFNAIKATLSEEATTAYFDPEKETTINPVGLAGILMQQKQTIASGSRSLTPVKKRYSQTEREALAVVWACEHINIYVSGAPSHVITDHQPLLGIWKKPDLPLRLARWSLRLQPYALTLLYQPGKNNPAYYISRHPMNTTKQSDCKPGTKNRRRIFQLHSQHFNSSCCHSDRGKGSYPERQNTPNSERHD